MNEEEKKAVEILNTFEFRSKTRNYKKISLEDSKSVKIVLNLIEKLQKENEELEEINNELEAEKNEAIRRYNFETIPIKKVKDKIEKLKQERTLKYDNYMGYKIESREQQDIDKKVQVLQELLEESEKEHDGK